MKFTAIISGLIFVCLVMQPLLTDWNIANACGSGTNATCYNKSKMHNDKIHNEKCSNSKSEKQNTENPCEGCNPLLCYVICVYIIPEQPSPVLPALALKSENTNELNNFLLPDYHPDFWHPPELFLLL